MMDRENDRERLARLLFSAVVVALSFAAGLAVGTTIRSQGHSEGAADDTAAQEGSEQPEPSTTESAPDADATASTTTPTTVPTTPPTTERLPVVHMSPQGDDEAVGQSPDGAVRSIERALALAQPGDQVLFGPGTYPPMEIRDVRQLSFAPLDATQDTIFTADSYDAGPGIHLIDSSSITIEDLSVTRALWGVMVEGSSDITIDGLTVFDVGQEGILIRSESNDVTVANNTVFDTGNRQGTFNGEPYATFGEAIYLGTGGLEDDGTVDTTFDVRVTGNTIFDTTAEAIDIKPSVSEVAVSDNVVYDVATSTSGAIVVGIGDRVTPDPQVVIERNVIFNVTRTSEFRDGTAIVVSAPAIVRANVIWGTEHFGIRIDQNLLSENGGSVVLESNLIASTGLDAIWIDDVTAGVAIDVGANFTGSPIETYLDPASPTAIVDAQAAAAELDAGLFVPAEGS